MRELARGRTLLVLALVMVVYLALHQAHPGARAGIAAGLFLEHAFAGLQAMLLLLALSFGLSATRAGGASGAREARRFAGEAGWFWGRALGLIGVLLAASFVGVTMTWVHHAARFGDTKGDVRPLRRHVVPEPGEGGGGERALRELGDVVTLDLRRPIARLEDGVAPLVLRVAPRLAIVRDGDPQRSHYPLAWSLSEPGGAWKRSGRLSLKQGKAARIFTEYRGRRAPERLVLRLTKIDPEYAVGIRPADVTLFAEPRSLVGSLLVGAALCALFAGVFGAIALFFAPRLGPAGALVIAGGLAVLAASLDALEVGALARLDAWPRRAIIDGLALLVPDFDGYDVSAWVARGRAPTWPSLLALGGRLATTLLVLGVLTGALGTPRRWR